MDAILKLYIALLVEALKKPLVPGDLAVANLHRDATDAVGKALAEAGYPDLAPNVVNTYVGQLVGDITQIANLNVKLPKKPDAPAAPEA